MKNLLRLLLLFSPLWSFGQPTQATLLGHWSDPGIVPAFFDNPYHDVWGIVVNDKEYGVISSTSGLHIFALSDISESEPMEPVAFVPGTAQGNGISHRDVKSYQHYLYGVADEGPSALQVIDVSGLPDGAELVYESNEFFTTAHNIFIDEDNARLYIAGSAGHSLKVLSLENPEHPELLASFPNSEYPVPYIHDLYVRDNIAYLHAGQAGFIVADFTDAAHPVLLGTMDTYPQQGYNHSGWLSDDGLYYYLCDETHSSDVKIVDMSDLDAIRVVSTMNAASHLLEIPHNVYLKDGLLYVSYYYDGLQVFDVSNPLFPRRVAYYDTYDGPDEDYFAGAWGVFTMPSGKVLISDMNNGLYVFGPIGSPPNTVVTPDISKILGCQGETTEFSLLVGDALSGEVTISTEGTSPGLDVSLSTTTAMPGDIVEGSITPNVAGEGLVVVFNVTDGANGGSSQIPAYIIGPPPAPSLLAPPDNKVNVQLNPFFLWINNGQIHPRVFELSTDSVGFEANIVYSASVPGNSHSLQMMLESGATYYWRIVTTGECGESISEVFSFTTQAVNALAEIGGNSFQLFPNPASDRLWLTFEGPLDEALQAGLLQADGRKVRTAQLAPGATRLELGLAGLQPGLYFLRLSTGEQSVTRKVVID
ncbi:MAG: choice-of-anchor B family protein [Lewinellaceae bacterium]|nr:choice-of-anchor B family protein [Lewinellaceae bacterium]